MDAYLPDEFAVSGDVVEYGNGTWEQYFSDGSVILGNSVTGQILYTDPNGVVHDAKTGSITDAPAAPILTVNPGPVVKNGEYFYRYDPVMDANGQTVYAGQAVTAAQATIIKKEYDATRTSAFLPLLAIGGALLIFG